MSNRKIVSCVGFMLFIVISVTAAAGIENQDISRDFFIDTYTGVPNCMLVVGEKAAVADILSASLIATQIGALSYYEEIVEAYNEQSITYNSAKQLGNIIVRNDINTYDLDNDLFDLGSVGTKTLPDSFAVLPYGCNKLPTWDYDIYLDPYISTGASDTWFIDTGSAFESLSIDLSIGEYTTSDVLMPAKIQDTIAADNTLSIMKTQSYPAIYMRHYWGTLEEGNFTDPQGGIAYRAVAYGYDNSAYVKKECKDLSYDLSNPLRESISTDLYTRQYPLFFLGHSYNALSFGTDETGHDYVLYGTPLWERSELSESSTIDCGNGISFSIIDLDVYGARIYLQVKNKEGATSLITLNEGDSFRVYEEIMPGIKTTIVCATFSDITIKSPPVTQCELYSLSSYGGLSETVYSIDEPFGEINGYEWYLDIVPNDSVQTVDLDNNSKLYEQKNPSYDYADALSLYTRDSSYPHCVPYLELWLATPLLPSENTTLQEISIPSLDNTSYMTIALSDTNHKDGIIDDYIKIYKKIKTEAAKVRHYVTVDTTKLAITDSEITPDIKSEYNLVLVGGPVANQAVRDVISLGYTSFDLWKYSNGEYVLYRDVFATGKDVLIVAGKDRDATNIAARSLIDKLSSL